MFGVTGQGWGFKEVGFGSRVTGGVQDFPGRVEGSEVAEPSRRFRDWGVEENSTASCCKPPTPKHLDGSETPDR